MFLINPIEKLIYYYDNNLKKIEWNFDIVKKSIENKVQKFKSYENYFINTNLCTDDFIIDRDTIIIDFHRKKEFKITSEVVSLYWWIDKVLKLYFSFKKNEKINKKHVLAFWGKITWLKKLDNSLIIMFLFIFCYRNIFATFAVLNVKLGLQLAIAVARRQ